MLFTHQIICKLLMLILPPFLLYGETVISSEKGNKPWMFFITNIIPPRGPAMAPQFSEVCFQKLSELFDSTSYQTILLRADQKIDKLSNRNKDLILSSDTAEYCSKGLSADTLIVWLRYKVGFRHSRIAVPYERGKTVSLPELLAYHVFDTAKSEFLSTLSLQAGPPGVTVNITEDIFAKPPCTFFIPPGTYIMNSIFPQFQKRLDTLEVIAGKQYVKRILLLPSEQDF